MNRLVEKLILVVPESSGSAGKIIEQAADLCDSLSDGTCIRTLRHMAYALIRDILSLTEELKVYKDPWKTIVAAYIAENENLYLMESGFMKKDCRILKEIFSYDFSGIDRALGEDCFSRLVTEKSISYKNAADAGRMIEKLRKALEDSDDFYTTICGFYRKYGSGVIGLNRAFTMEVCRQKSADKSIRLIPVKQPDNVKFSDLIGYEQQKKRLMENTQDFLNGLDANNVLLYGDGGTGKSTSIRALINEYGDKGLKLIQVYRHQMKYLNRLISMLKDRRHRFIIYMDDLSFEDFETEYKYLKAVIEGGLEKRPDNVLVYATSNRRNLIKETWKDRNDTQYKDDIHRSDSMEEKQSLAERFGIRIFYGKPNREEFYRMVKILSDKEGIEIPPDVLKNEANKWEVRNGGVSGRSARQFVDYIRGREVRTDENNRCGAGDENSAGARS